MDLHDLLIQVSTDLLYILVTILVSYLIGYLKKKYGVEKLKEIDKELQTKQELAIIAVKFVEQAYKEIHGQEKYNKAVEWLSNRLKEIKINISEDELKGLIEFALRNIKDQLGEQWPNAV